MAEQISKSNPSPKFRKLVTAQGLYRRLLWIASVHTSIALFAGVPLIGFGMNWTARQL